jgi:hypothetical protein
MGLASVPAQTGKHHETVHRLGAPSVHADYIINLNGEKSPIKRWGHIQNGNFLPPLLKLSGPAKSTTPEVALGGCGVAFRRLIKSVS